MHQIHDAYRGLTLIFDLNADLLLWVGTIAAALAVLAAAAPV